MQSLGPCVIQIPCPTGLLEIHVEIVEIDIPLLFGLDAMDQHRLQVLTVTNELKCVGIGDQLGWSQPVCRRDDHVCFDFTLPTIEQAMFYTQSQLKRLHRHLYHPSAGKLYNLLKKIDADDLPADTRETLEQISKLCRTCQQIANKPHRFRIRFPDDIVFNRELRLYLMFLDDRRPVLHVVDAGTTFQAATFLSGEEYTSVWNAFLVCWSRLFVGDPEKIAANAGSCFASAAFMQACRAHDIFWSTLVWSLTIPSDLPSDITIRCGRFIGN